MRTFFTQRGVEGVDEKEVEAIDIVTTNYNIAIRGSGLSIKQKNKKNEWEEVEDFNMNLGE